MSSNLPKPEAIQALAQSNDSSNVVMLNLLKFRPKGGLESYREYARKATPILERLGAKILFDGAFLTTVIGERDWDSIILVQYPSRRAFIDMVTSPEYQAILHLRQEALESSELHAISPTGALESRG